MSHPAPEPAPEPASEPASEPAAAPAPLEQRYCPSCGLAVSGPSAFCTGCGSSLSHPGLRAAPLAPLPRSWESPFAPLPPTNGLAIASLICGIVWIWWLGSLAAVILGHIALHQVKRSQGRQRGRGVAFGGLALGYLGLLALVAFILVAVLAHPHLAPQSPPGQGTDHLHWQLPHPAPSPATRL